jgi:hypothetical protein
LCLSYGHRDDPVPAFTAPDGTELAFTEEHRREAAALPTAEPWFMAAHDAYEAVWAGSATDADWDAITPFF